MQNNTPTFDAVVAELSFSHDLSPVLSPRPKWDINEAKERLFGVLVSAD